MDALRCYQNNVKTSFSVLPSPPTRHSRCMLLGYGVRTVKIGRRNVWFFFARQPLSVRRKACYKWFLLDAITTAGGITSVPIPVKSPLLHRHKPQANSIRFSTFLFFVLFSRKMWATIANNKKRFAEWWEGGGCPKVSPRTLVLRTFGISSRGAFYTNWNLVMLKLIHQIKCQSNAVRDNTTMERLG